MNDDDFERNMRSRDGLDARAGGSGVSPALIALGVVSLVAIIFFFRNSQTTTIDFLFFKPETKTRWLVIVCIAIGVALDRLFAIWWRRRRRAKAERR